MVFNIPMANRVINATYTKMAVCKLLEQKFYSCVRNILLLHLPVLFIMATWQLTKAFKQKSHSPLTLVSMLRALLGQIQENKNKQALRLT